MSTDSLKDPKLSFKAKGVLAYLMSKPEVWKSRVMDLKNHSTDGRQSIQAALRELREQGYARIILVRSKDQKHLAGRELVVTDTPKNVKDGKPDFQETCRSGNESVRKSDPINKEKIKKKKGSVGPADSPRKLIPSLPDPVVKFSRAVILFSEFSRSREFHLSPFTKTGFAPGGQKGGWSRATLLEWQRIWSQLTVRVPKKEVLKVLKWYSRNFGEQYVPVAQTFKVFAEKFQKIRAAMVRQERDRAREQEKSGTVDEASEMLRDMSPEERKRYEALPIIKSKK